MDFTRRQFIQVTGATAAGLAVSGLGFDLKPIKAHAQMLKTEYAKQTTSICPYCAVGCGVIVYTSQKGDGRVIDIEGDPDHVINRGTLVFQGRRTVPALRKQTPRHRSHVPSPLFQRVENGLLGLGVD